MKNLLIVLLGPTGVGKTDLSIDIARLFKCEIISADSRQFYREMRIGTSVPTESQLAEIKHHFIRFISVKDYYSASLFERDVLNLLQVLFAKRNVALMTGGSGMYIDAVCDGIDDIPDIEPSVREKIKRKYEKEGAEGLRLALKLLDPAYYKQVDLKNPKRLIRALEICESTGLPYSSFLTNLKRKRDFEILKIGLNRTREDLYCRINNRVDKMMEEGLEKEAGSLFEFRSLNALNCVGYKELFSYFEGKTSREGAVNLIKRDTRRFAKRQMTWWKKDKSITWSDPEELHAVTELIGNRLYSMSGSARSL